VSRRRWLLVALFLPVALLLGAATLWQSDQVDPRYARVLLLDPRTGKTLHAQVVDGGYAVVALLTGGRVAVATLDSCPQGKGGSLLVLDASLEHVLSTRSMNPCTVARIDPPGLRARFEKSQLPAPDYNGGRDLTVRLGRGKIVETYDQKSGLFWFSALTAYDASGRVLWKRDSLGRIGVVDVRDGRAVVPVFGEFTPGSD
jgi:hypothetical protein